MATGATSFAATNRLIALCLVAAASCVVQSAPPPPPPAPAPQLTPPASSKPDSRLVELEDGSYVEIRPGVEHDFVHCCGDGDYMMEVQCSENLLRCYRRAGRRWKQTFGKHCSRELDQECYSQTCTRVCEAYWLLGEERWNQFNPRGGGSD